MRFATLNCSNESKQLVTVVIQSPVYLRTLIKSFTDNILRRYL